MITTAKNDIINNIYGIDLGTTNCCISLWENGSYIIIRDKYGYSTIPSIIGICNNEIIIGNDVLKNQNIINKENIIYNIKRLIGRKYSDIKNISDHTYNVNKNENDDIIITVNEQKYYPDELLTMLLCEIKNEIKKFIKIRNIDENNEKIKVIVTIPAYFNDIQRQITLKAIHNSNLECIKILNEPTAAAMAYGYEKRYDNDDIEHVIMIYDMGGGTTDISILNIYNGVFEVLTSYGNTTLGGVDFDNNLVKYCIDMFNDENNTIISPSDISKDILLLLKNKCETVKKNISNDDNLNIFIDNFYDNKKLDINITQDIFHDINEILLHESIKPILIALESCELTFNQIEDIIMVGGATKMKILRNKISRLFNKNVVCNINSDEVVAIGASIQGFILTNKSDPFTNNIVLLDIIPLSLGVETMGGIMDVVIKKNTIIPTTQIKKYTNDTDNITSIKIKIYEGERLLTKDNIYIWEN